VDGKCISTWTATRQMDVDYSADMISHWEDGDVCVHELFYNVSPPLLVRLWTD